MSEVARSNSEVFTIARDIKKESDIINERMDVAAKLFLNGDPSEWAGRDADAYKRNLSDLSRKMNQISRDIESVSLEIEKQAEQIEEQDKTNANKIDNEG